VTREEFRAWNRREIVNVLRHLPGVTVRPNPTYEGGGVTGVEDRRRYVVETRRGGATTFNSAAGPECPVSYWLDGMPVGNSRDDPIDDLVPVENLEAIESYVGVQAPAQYAAQSQCGVIAFWTRQDVDVPSHGGRSGLVGALVGAGIGVTLGLVSSESCQRCLFPTERGKRSIANGIVLGMVGVLVWRMIPTSSAHLINVQTLDQGPYRSTGVGLVYRFH
jgi:hypothetical protein